MKLNEKDLVWIQKFLTLTKVDKNIAAEMSAFIRAHIDPKCHSICAHCSTEVQWAAKRIKSWWERVGEAANFQPEPVVKVAKTIKKPTKIKPKNEISGNIIDKKDIEVKKTNKNNTGRD